MLTVDQIIQDLNWVTDRLSTQIRTVALSVLALAWGLLLSDKDPTKSPDVLNLKWHLIGIAGICILVLVFDYLQYLTAYVETKGVFDAADASHDKKGQYNKKSLSYRLRGVFFTLKQLALAAAVVWLCITLGRWLWIYR